MVKRVFSNATILEGEELELTQGYLVIRDGSIEKISEGSPPGRAIDLKRGFILPPFVNAHTHVADSVVKELYLGRTQPQAVGPGGEKFRALDSYSRSELLASIRSTFQDMSRTGTIAHCDFREGGARGVELLRKASHKAVKSIIMGRPSTLEELGIVLKKSDGIGLPSLDAFDDEGLRSIADQTKRAKKFLSVHVAELPSDRNEVELALELRPSFIVHATHANEGDFVSARKNSVPVVFCPRANSLLGVGVPPIQLALATNTRFCLGTDNTMVCQPNMFEELSFAWACLRRADPAAGGEEARKLLKAATIEPLKLFNLPWGPIGEGGSATFMVLSRGDNLTNLTNVYAGLVNRARADNIRAIYTHGKIL
ncbi:MAG: amidohydrolase family protein [Candidatus Hadarchaeaceae archaeon]